MDRLTTLIHKLQQQHEAGMQKEILWNTLKMIEKELFPAEAFKNASQVSINKPYNIWIYNFKHEKWNKAV